jgi:hypothetical protein
MEDDELDERAARRSGAYSCVLNAGGMVIEYTIERKVGGIPAWSAVLSASVGIALLVGLMAARRRPRLRLGTAVFLLNAAAVNFTLWMTHPYYAAAAGPWRPFEPHKLGALTVALLAPNRWAGLLGIFGYVGSAVLQFQLFPGAAHKHLSVTEPWATVAYGAFSVALLAYRLRGLALARAVARGRAEAAVLQRLARASLNLRDLANTPLQTLELSLALLRSRGDLAPVVARMERALMRLQALGRALSQYEAPGALRGDLLRLDSEPGVGNGRGVVVAPPVRRPRA